MVDSVNKTRSHHTISSDPSRPYGSWTRSHRVGGASFSSSKMSYDEERSETVEPVRTELVYLQANECCRYVPQCALQAFQGSKRAACAVATEDFTMLTHAFAEVRQSSLEPLGKLKRALKTFIDCRHKFPPRYKLLSATPKSPRKALTGLPFASVHGLIDLQAGGRMRREKGRTSVAGSVNLLIDLLFQGGTK